MIKHTTKIGGEAAGMGGEPGRPMERLLMDKAECAALLGIKPRTLEKYMWLGRIPFIRLSQKLVRFHRGDVMAALRGQQ